MSVSIDSMAAEIIKSLQRYGEAVSEDVDAAAETRPSQRPLPR